MNLLASALVAALLSAQPAAETAEARLQRLVDAAYAANPAAVGFSVHVEAPDARLSYSYATGYSDREAHQPLSAAQPMLIASNTKPYVAAAILRLVEQGKLRLEQPVSGLLSPRTRQALTAAGYDLAGITLVHLLSHTSGIRDYVDEEYFKFVGAHRRYSWTRDEQIARAAKAGKPLAKPGEAFKYADINYVLLTEVIEQATGAPFFKAMRALLDYRGLHLNQTWFAKLEPAPKSAAPRAHQYWDEFGWDTYDLDPSWDLYGGGGMVATTADMALFFQDLFNGRVIHDPAVLATMHKDVPPNLEINYCLGIRKVVYAGLPAFNHGGGLGTDVVYVPALNASVAVAVMEASHRPAAVELSKQIVQQLGTLKK